MALLRRNKSVGEFVLRFARLKNIGPSGTRKGIGRILRNEDQRFMADAMIAERLSDAGLGEEEESGFLQRILEFFSDPENRAMLEEIISWITTFFDQEFVSQ